MKDNKNNIENLDFNDNIDVEFEIEDITDLSNENNNISQENNVEQKSNGVEQNASSIPDGGEKDMSSNPANDVEKDMSSKPNNDVETLDTEDESSSNQGKHEDNNENITPNSSDNNVSSNEDKNNDVQDYNNLDGTPEEKQSLRDKAKETKDKIKNAPEDIRNKVNDTKEKAKETANKIKNAPENIKNKVNDTKDKVKNVKDNAKQKWDNRPKNFKDFKDKTKNGIKNGGKNAKNKIKNGAKNAINNSDTMKKINKAKDDIDKAKKIGKKVKKNGKAVAKAGKAVGKAIASAAKGLLNLFISTLPWSAIALVIIAVISLLIVVIIAVMPGIGGDVNDNDNYEQYSNTDQKTLEKIKKIFNKHPTADGTLAMSVVLYPYYYNLYSGNVSIYIENEVNEDEQIEEELDEKETNNDDKDIEQEEDVIEDDNYLIPLRSKKVRKRLETVLTKLETSDEAGFKEYLKNEYFGKDGGFKTFWYHDLFGYNGYKKLLNNINDNDKETVKDLIIEDIYDNKELFVDYVFNNAICSATLVDAGNVPVTEMLKSNILVDVKVESCTTSKGVNDCDSWYPNPIPLSEYIKGVVWTEIGVSTSTDIEQIKAQMVAAKSFVLGRYKSMGWKLNQTEDGTYVIPIRPNTNDQDYCNYEEGCINKRSGNKHGIAGEAEKNILNEAWEAVKDVYIMDENNNTAGSYCADRNKHNGYDCSWCKHGYCLSQTELTTYINTPFENILGDQYSKYGLVTIEGDNATMKVAGDIVCSENITNYTAVRNQIALAIKNAKDNNIPHYENGLATSKTFEENNFSSDVTPDSLGRDKLGLSNVGFVNYIYWNVLDNNFGNTNDINPIINDGFEITQDQLLVGDIGYSSDKSVIGIYYGNNVWAYMDKVNNGIVIAPTDIFQNYIRINNFKSETYNYWIRDRVPTLEEWGGSKMHIVPRNHSNVGQCVWYARNRAVEIIKELKSNGSLTENQYSRYYNRIVAQAGDGKQHAPGGTASNGFSGSTNIYDIKPGSFVGLESGSAPPYGHVAIIEKADIDENGNITNIILTHGWADGNCNLNNFSCVNFKKKEFATFAEYEKWVNSMLYRSEGRGRYKFKGYLYFLED